VVLVATLGATVKGRVVDEAGKPIARPIAVTMRSTLTSGHNDNDGHFILVGMEPDKDADVRVAPSTGGYAYYHRVLHLESTVLKPGATVDVGDLRWERPSGKPNVRGNVRTSSGEIFVEQGLMRVFELMGLDEPVVSTIHARNGHFELEVRPGRYGVFSPSFEPLPSGKPIMTVTVAPTGITEFDITVDPKPAAK
jgi:hypothetical protein